MLKTPVNTGLPGNGATTLLRNFYYTSPKFKIHFSEKTTTLLRNFGRSFLGLFPVVRKLKNHIQAAYSGHRVRYLNIPVYFG